MIMQRTFDDILHRFASAFTKNLAAEMIRLKNVQEKV